MSRMLFTADRTFYTHTGTHTLDTSNSARNQSFFKTKASRGKYLEMTIDIGVLPFRFSGSPTLVSALV